MKKQKHSKILSREKSNQEIIDSYDYLSNAASAQDCTGLIPSGPASKAELESIVNNAVMRIVTALGQMGFYLDGELLARAVQAIQDGLDMRYNPVKVI